MLLNLLQSLDANRARSEGESLASIRHQPESLTYRNVLVVEYRDEVFTRLAADMSGAGLRVERAVGAAAASRVCVRWPADLMVANVDLPDESGWLLTAKLRLATAMPRIWLYALRPSSRAAAMAEHLGADGFIAYEGDLCRLSAAILSRISALPAARLSA